MPRPAFLPLLLALSAVTACGADPGGGPGPRVADPVLFVNEVMPSNTAVLADELGEYDDWIELYNAGAAELDLEGTFISDDPADPFRKRLPEGLSVGPGDVLLLWADGDPEQGATHLPFKLKASGESVLLTDPDGALLDSVTWSEAPTDQAFARFPDGSGEPILCASPSAGERNGATCGGE